LETAANPYMTILGPAETASQRLNFAQAFNGLGAFIAAFFLSKVILSGKEISEIMLSKLSASEANSLLAQEAKSLQTPYIIIGLVLLFVAVLFMVVRFPEEKKQVRTDIPDSGTFNLFKHKNVLLGIAAQFFYVGAQVCISSFFIRYAKFSAGLEELEAATYLGFLLMGFMIGRYAGTFLMQYIKPEKLLMYYSIASILLLAMVVFLGGKFSLYALIGVEFFMSIMFPTIFSLAIGGLGVKTKIASSYIVMSIVGGAFLPVIMGKTSDLFNIQLAYLIPAICFFVVLYFSIKVKPIHVPVKEI
jgi:FHS family L-fucose permease-like MFS transporter